MNNELVKVLYSTRLNKRFRSQQGLPIMNAKGKEFFENLDLHGFRPQQGLPIMNI